MNAATALLIGKLIDMGMAITGALADVGVNYREVMDEQEAAKKEGRPVNTQMFLDQAQSAIDKL